MMHALRQTLVSALQQQQQCAVALVRQSSTAATAGAAAAATKAAKPKPIKLTEVGKVQRPRPPKGQARLDVTWNNRKNAELEKQARTGKLEVPLPSSATFSDHDWLFNRCDKRVVNMARHYKIFEHLFPKEFAPVKNLVATFKSEQVHRGNIIKPELTLEKPSIKFESAPESTWTLALYNIDGRLDGGAGEVTHWLVGNIKGNDLSTGKELLPYVPAVPLQNSGYNRFAFVLFEHASGPADFSNLSQKSECRRPVPLSDRYLLATRFANDHNLVPRALAFCQIEWSKNVAAAATKIYGSS